MRIASPRGNSTLWGCVVLSGLLSLAGCSSLKTNSEVYREDVVTEEGEPGYITVQHCLIGFQGSVPSAARSQEEAEQLAQELFEKAMAGADFDQIVREHTDDSPPGIYQMANNGFESDMSSRIPSKHVYARSGMVAAFGDVGFQLDVGEIEIAPYDATTSPFGWHIIKRIK
ncbi:peptidylprolyl isomerase [Aureliella helgolandensis]|uniref:Chaperone SurA n=1 Tax=Aureliella helgolandensis TaxID=2527968 RepID=A0A518FZH7_9BACT|nr:peptidylprolyl isomerase [Aureliella helgolandensis]QDV21762.1 Chaperone SurA precursor [Aureliella helgolandensis]